MTINAEQFRSFVIDPALAALQTAGVPVSKTAADLLMATAAVESDLGTWLGQIDGPALNVFQIEASTWRNAIAMTTFEQLAVLRSLTAGGLQDSFDESATNLKLAAAMARLIYWQSPMPLPADTPAGLWSMYKSVWNTYAGATTEAEFMAALKLTDIAT